MFLHSETEDKDRYDTTIGIPTKLPDRIYILQTAMLVGNSKFNCKSDEDLIAYSCFKSGGPSIIGHKLHTGKHWKTS